MEANSSKLNRIEFYYLGSARVYKMQDGSEIYWCKDHRFAFFDIPSYNMHRELDHNGKGYAKENKAYGGRMSRHFKEKFRL